MTAMTLRESFEAWLKPSRPFADFTTGSVIDGRWVYDNFSIQKRWAIFQAGAQAMQEQAAKWHETEAETLRRDLPNYRGKGDTVAAIMNGASRHEYYAAAIRSLKP